VFARHHQAQGVTSDMKGSHYFSLFSVVLHNNTSLHKSTDTSKLINCLFILNKIVFTMSVIHPTNVSVSDTYDTDSALNALVSAAGLKKNSELPKSHMNLFDGENLFPKDIGVDVTIQLQREKDTSLPHRHELATEVCETLASELKSVFQGEEENKDATIVVRILLVSDGSSKGSRWKGGTGKAKLTLAWLLVDNKSDRVALGRQIYLTEDCSPAADSNLDHLEFSSAKVRSMARDAAAQIEEECTSAIIDWKSQPKPMAEVAPKKKKIHEEHEVGEERFTVIQRLLKNLTQI
jgi:hypothetical protein